MNLGFITPWRLWNVTKCQESLLQRYPKREMLDPRVQLGAIPSREKQEILGKIHSA
jgi:hypothetical protein